MQTTKKCYICGCVKSCSVYLDNVFANIRTIGELFDEYTVIIYVDKSIDDSLEKLLFLKDMYKDVVSIHILINYDTVSEFRTFNIAKGRNKLMEHMNTMNDSSYEYFIMMDMDDVCVNMVDSSIITTYLQEITDWDSLSFNKADYYDIWALSIGPFHYSCWHFITDCGQNIAVEIEKKYVSGLLHDLPTTELLECYSAFNGFAIYKRNKFINCTYRGNVLDNFTIIGKEHMDQNEKYTQSRLFVNTDNLQDCEHRSFHYEAIIKNNAKIRISPQILFR
jgi:hypothetical protein